MTLPIRTLKIQQRWDCHGCGDCCWGTIIRLSDDDLAKIRSQHWGRHSQYRGVRLLKRLRLWKKVYRLAHRKDGHCVFLTPEGLCRIHQDHGLAAKPLICQMFPFQLVPLGDFAYLTLRRNCPSAAADKGRELRKHLGSVRQMAEQGQMASRRRRPPAITGTHRRSWEDTFRITEAVQRLMLDEKSPPVRRLVHALQLCKLLQMCRLRRLSGKQLGALLPMLETSAVAEAEEVFRSRRAPAKSAAGMFRQTAFEYVRLDRRFVPEKSWRQRIRLVRDALAFARGKGKVFRLHSDLPQTTFEALERPLGHLDAEVLRPLGRYFETAAASVQYAVLGRRRWPLVDAFGALAMAFAVAMWLLRLYCTDGESGGRPPTVDDVIRAVGVIERGQTYAALCGRRHRTRVRAISRIGEMSRLAAWYAR